MLKSKFPSLTPGHMSRVRLKLCLAIAATSTLRCELLDLVQAAATTLWFGCAALKLPDAGIRSESCDSVIDVVPEDGLNACHAMNACFDNAMCLNASSEF